MALPSMTFPERPLQVSPPGSGRIANLGTLLWTALLLLASAYFLLPPIADLRDDFTIADTARPVQGGRVEGRCRTSLGVLVRCTATLTAPGRGGPQLQREVDYFFVDFHLGDYTATVVADPVRPALLSTDLALERLWNRVYTLATAIPLGLGLLFGALRLAGQRIGERRSAVDALSGHVLHPVLLRLDSYLPGRWTVTPLPPTRDRRSRTWPVPRAARPIVMDPERRLVLGVAAGSEELAMPLDTGLSWIGLERGERLRLRQQLGPDRLGGWLPNLGRAGLDDERAALSRRARRLGLSGGGLALLAALAAWVAWGGHDFSGDAIVLRRGDEGPASGEVRLNGIRHTELAVQTTRVDARAAHLEVWVPLTAPDWQAGQPVVWLIDDPEYGRGEPRAATLVGSVAGPVPDRAREQLARLHVQLSPEARVLAARAWEPPWQLPAIIVSGIGGTLGAGLLLGAALLGLRVRALSAQLRSR